MLIRPDEGAGKLAEWLLSEYGPFVPISQVWRQLSYPSLDAARRSFSRGLAPIAAIKLPGRRGQFVKTAEFAAWLQAVSRPHDAYPDVQRSDAQSKQGAGVD